MSHKYLKDKNFPKYYWGDTLPKNDHRRVQWKKSRKIYGFDERETWNLNDTFLCWLYEHIKMYIDVACVDFNYNKFSYEDKEYTQEQILNKILEDIELYFNADDCYMKRYGKNYIKWWDDQVHYINEIGKLWAMVLPAMWW